VGHEQDRLPAPPELRRTCQALVREPLVADGEHLVDEQDVGMTWMATANPRRMYMPGGVTFSPGASNEVLHLANSTISVEALAISRF